MQQVANAHPMRNSEVQIKFTGRTCSGKTLLARFVAEQLQGLGLSVDADYERTDGDVLTVATGSRELAKVYMRPRSNLGIH
jgi:adenylylsulfate kinase-like enzyme